MTTKIYLTQSKIERRTTASRNLISNQVRFLISINFTQYSIFLLTLKSSYGSRREVTRVHLMSKYSWTQSQDLSQPSIDLVHSPLWESKEASKIIWIRTRFKVWLKWDTFTSSHINWTTRCQEILELKSISFLSANWWTLKIIKNTLVKTTGC
jgi:hypothetical protein